MSLDPLDLKLLSVLQDDAALSNAELADRIGLSPSQCSRRRAGLEEAGYIRAYRADLDPRKLGYTLDGTLRRRLEPVVEGEPWRDSLLFTMLADELGSSACVAHDYVAYDVVGNQLA